MNAAWMIEGSKDSACMSVVYDAMIIGGSGGKSPAWAGEGACSTGYDGWFVIEAFGRALPDLAAATRVWRDLFPSPEHVYKNGLAFMKAQVAVAKK